MSLAHILTPDPADQPAPFRIGVVTVTSPLTVRVGAATTAQPCRRLVSYTPVTVGDVVIVLVSGPDRVVLGKTTT